VKQAQATKQGAKQNKRGSQAAKQKCKLPLLLLEYRKGDDLIFNQKIVGEGA